MHLRCDLHPLLLAPAIGEPVTLRTGARVRDRLAELNGDELAARAAAAGGGRVQAAIGRTVKLDSGRVEVCAADHVVSVRIGQALVGVQARDLHLAPAPTAAETALGV